MNPKPLDELHRVTGWLMANLTAAAVPSERLSAEKLAERAATERLVAAMKSRSEERQFGVPLGATPVPLNLDVMDLLGDVLDFAAKWSGLPTPTTCFDDPLPHLRAATTRVRLGALDGDRQAVYDGCEDLTTRAQQVLGLVLDGQLLAGLCPWCGGRTSRHPVGGARTLRVRLAELWNASSERCEAVPVVVCESSLCAPPASDFGVTWHGRPAWPQYEWEWLCLRIVALDDVAS